MIAGCHRSVMGLGGRARPSSRHRMPDLLLGSSQVAPPTAWHTGARYGSTMVGSGLGGGCRFSADAKAEVGPVTTALGLLAEH